MSRQERTASRVRKSAASAEKVIAEAVTKVKCRECEARGTRVGGVSTIPHKDTCSRYKAAMAKWAGDRLKPAGTPRQRAPQKPATATKPAGGTGTPEKAPSGGSDDLATECKRLRDGLNLSWMAIGAKLGLPGSKSGAANARKLYAQANGGSRPTGTVRGTGGTRKRKGDQTPKHVANTGSKRARLEALAEQGHVIPTDTPDEEILAMVRGRTIQWSINVNRVAGHEDDEVTVWLEQEARVHPTDLYVEEDLDKYGSKVLRFREYMGLNSETGRPMSGPTRSVRINSIHTVR